MSSKFSDLIGAWFGEDKAEEYRKKTHEPPYHDPEGFLSVAPIQPESDEIERPWK